ncbi:hypothetical protein PCANB_000487 [Pneumocystis canis]|nr:hypothetical protein PCANB_000487 [Pneumocystis canis]
MHWCMHQMRQWTIKYRCYRMTQQVHRLFHTISLRQNHLSLICSAFHFVHDTGIPWWATISLTTLFVRVAMLPIVFWSRNRMIRYIHIKPLIKAWKFQTIQFSNDAVVDTKKIEKLNQKQNELCRYACYPIQLLVLPLVQTPLFLMMTFALRGMSGWSLPLFANSNIPIEPAFTYEGVAWMHDLTVPDPTGFLPVCLGLNSLINIQLNLYFYKEMFPMSVFLTRLAQGNALIFIFVSMQAPTALCLYWF